MSPRFLANGNVPKLPKGKESDWNIKRNCKKILENLRKIEWERADITWERRRECESKVYFGNKIRTMIELLLLYY